MRIRAWMLIVAVGLTALVGCRDRDGDEDAGPDPMMDSGPPAGGENTAALCDDGMDNDDDTFIDCDDTECCDLVSCGPDTRCGQRSDAGDCTMTGPEDNATACGDGMDNDCDGFIDCVDLDCPASACGSEGTNRDCNDGMDNDMDGNADCEDFGCRDLVVCAGEATNAACSDGMDNDGDGDMDCDDENCQDEAIVVCDGATPTGLAEAMWPGAIMTACTDGMDNDGDDRFDCAEFSCLWNYGACSTPDIEQTNASCSDGVDNDQDGNTDCEDTRCQGEGIVVCDGTTPVTVAPAMYEAMSSAICMDGMSNDANAFIDCDDFSCTQNPDVSQAACPGDRTDATCMDMVDNDTDMSASGFGFVDCDDFGCSMNPTVTACTGTENTFDACVDGIDNDMDNFADCADFDCEDTPACTTASMM